MPTIPLSEAALALLRRRLSNAPRQVKILEERLLQSRADLSRALGQNEKLVSVLQAERERLEWSPTRIRKSQRGGRARAGGAGKSDSAATDTSRRRDSPSLR